jgi:NADH dehydrogenase FAD-containing subunit
MSTDLDRLMQLVVTRHIWGKGLSAEQMQERLSSVLDEGRRHLVTVRKAGGGRLGIEFAAGLGDVERAFKEAAKSSPPSDLPS